MSGETCGHEREDGTGCGTSFGLCPECGRCFNHCAHRADERRAASEKGAYVAAKGPGALFPGEVPPAPESLEDAVVWAAWAARAAATGDLDTARANAAARLLKEFRQALERSEAREELEELRRKLEDLHGDSPDLEALP